MPKEIPAIVRRSILRELLMSHEPLEISNKYDVSDATVYRYRGKLNEAFGNDLLDFDNSPPVYEGEVVDVNIVSKGKEGDGVGYIDGYTIFVPGSNPGVQAKVRLTRVRGHYAFGELLESKKMPMAA